MEEERENEVLHGVETESIGGKTAQSPTATYVLYADVRQSVETCRIPKRHCPASSTPLLHMMVTPPSGCQLK